MIATRAADNQCTIIYANLVGANDGLVFDGGGYVSQNGRPVLDAPRFVEGYATCVVDLDRTIRCRREASTWRSDLEEFRRASRLVSCLEVEHAVTAASPHAFPAPLPGTTFFLPSADVPTTSARDGLLDDFYEAMALAVADYFRKTGAFRAMGVALSGGRDSLLTLLVAGRAAAMVLGDGPADARAARTREMLQTFYMPSRFSSEATRAAAEQSARDVGARFAVISIEEAFDREARRNASDAG